MSTPSSSNLQAVLFDLDGTLIDHFRTIYRCYRYALEQLGLDPVPYEQVRAAVGGSIAVTFGKLIPASYVDEAVDHFREEFDRIWHEDIEVLDGAPRILDSLHERGLKLAVFTNKEGDRARRVLDHVGLARRLDGVFGTLDTPFRKPQPAFTYHVLRELAVDARHACMIGDSPYDVEAAAAVGMPGYVVATGSHTEEQLREETEAAGVYRDLPNLASRLFGLSGTKEMTA